MATTNTTTKRKAPATTAKGKATNKRKAPATQATTAPATTPTPRLPKCAAGRLGKAKPQAKMLRVIASIGQHPGTALRIKRWPNYAVGMTLHHCSVTPGLDHKDVLFWTEHKGADGKPLMVLRDATKDEVAAADEAWAKAQAQAQDAKAS